MASTTRRPWAEYAPFAVVAALAELTQLIAVSQPRHPWAQAASAVLVVALVVAGAVLVWSAAPRRVLNLLPFGFLLVVALWRHAGGTTPAPLGMVGLSVLWLGLHGTRRQVWAGVAAVAVVLGGPLLLGGTDYPASDWPRAVLYTAFAALLGPITHQLVAQRESDAGRIRDLEPSDARFRGLLEAAVGHVVVGTDLDGILTVFNPGARRLVGWREEQVVGRLPLASLVPVRELGERARALGVDAGFESLVAPVREGGADTRDWTWLTSAGDRRTVALTMSGVHDAEGSLTGFIGIGTDVTEQRATERALATQREVLRLVVEHLPNTVVGLLDRDLRWVTISGSWLADHDVDPGSFVGLPVGERLDMRDPEGLRAFLTASFGHGRQHEFETGTGTWFEVDAEPVTGPAGEQLLLMVGRDVTVRRQYDAERAGMLAALRASEEGFRTAFDQAPAGIALTSVEQGADAALIRVNAAFAELVGRDPADLEGQPLDTITHPDDAATRPAAGDLPASYQTRYMRPSGRPVWVSVHAAAVPDDAGHPAYVISHVVDVTGRRASEQALFEALEQQRAAAEALRELDAVRVDTMSTISHELRTPLTSIEGYVELLGDSVPGALNDEQATMLDVVRRNAERLRSLVDDLLDLSRLDHQAGSPAGTDPVDLGALVAGVIETLRPVAVRGGVTLGVEAATAGTAMLVAGDVDQIDRAITNLVANAVKYTPDGGRVDLGVHRAGDQVVVSVADTGIGIPAEEQKRLFDRFFRASTAQRRGIEGTGLGLAITQSIVERHGGRVDVVSEPGRGSTFSMALPALEVRTQPEPSR